MNNRQKELIEQLGLSQSDFEAKEVVNNDERLNDLETAICELVDALAE